MNCKNLLIELGTEELPPKSLRKLATSLHDDFIKQLINHGLKFKESKWYATPRRLAIYIKELDEKQADRTIEVKGPAIKVAFDSDGNPSKAALGWAAANGIDIAKADRLKTEKGEWLYIKKIQEGSYTASIIPELFLNSLKSLPIPRLMHWGDKRDEFVRPVHTLCVLFGNELIDCTILGIKSSKILNGHRFLGQQKVTVESADSYVETLKNQGYVIADYEERKASIIKQVKAIADANNGVADLDDALVEEVTSIVEAPHIFQAKFEERFLKVPSEALVYTMKGDQKYFPIYDKHGKLLPVFAFASNINPANATSLISGNERVVRPRLSDAEFFFNTDRKHNLEYFYNKLENIIYQKDIGTLAYRTSVVEELSAYIADTINADVAKARRAAHLAKCDLATTMVTEFTDTQGIMGMHYAELDGESSDVAEAIFEQYCPRFAGDKVPTKPVQISVSIAEKLVTLVSIFGINMLPKGDKDPFGLRRAAIGLIRIIIENNIDLNIVDSISKASSLLSDKLKNKQTISDVVEFVYNRLKAYYQDQCIETSMFLSVLSVKPQSILDFDARVKAVKAFKDLPQAADLASAYKRISKILAKSEGDRESVDSDILKENAEIKLNEHVEQVKTKIIDFYNNANYKDALSTLAELKDDVDNFFEKVMVNVDNTAIKENRLALLRKLSSLMSNTADISVLY